MRRDISNGSLTFTIKGNVDHVNEYEPENIEYVDEDEGDVFPLYPYEFDISVNNYRTIWCAIGLPINLELREEEIFGEINPDKLLSFIEKAPIELCIKEDYKYIDSYGNFLTCSGLDEKRVRYIFRELIKLATEAKKRQEIIIWA